MEIIEDGEDAAAGKATAVGEDVAAAAEGVAAVSVVWAAAAAECQAGKWAGRETGGINAGGIIS